MKKVGVLFGSVLLGLVAVAAGKEDPVAAAYPDWTGVTAKNRIGGREICPSDLRHKVTIVIEIDATENLQAQLVSISSVAALGRFNPGFGLNWEDAVVPRDVITLVILHNAKNREAVYAALKAPKDDAAKALALVNFSSANSDLGVSMYENVTYTGAPETEGKRPYYYVLGPEGRAVIAEGTLSAKTAAEAKAAVAKAKKAIADWETPWRPFVGCLPDEKVHPALMKALEKGRAGKPSPLEVVAKGLVKGVLSKDEAAAREAQIQYDAIYQARGDLVHRIFLEATCPHRAAYDITELLKYYPREKKRVETVSAKILAKPEYAMMAKTFGRMMALQDPDFKCKNASEAKKIVQELGKMKKKVEPLKESKDVPVQNGALILDMKLEELISRFDAQASVK